MRKMCEVSLRMLLLVSSLIIASTAQAALVGEWTFDSQTFVNSGTAGSVHDGTFVTSNTGYFSTNTASGSGYSLRIQSIAEHDSTTGGDVLLINNSKTTDASYTNTFDGAAFTVSMWVKTEDADWFQWDEFAGKSLESGVQAGWALRSKYGDTIRFDSYGDSTAESSVDALDESWHMITATYDGIAGNMNLYIDGNLKDTATSATISDASLYALAFGARADGSRGENMLIDELQFYNTELSATEIVTLYGGEPPIVRNPIITHIYTADPSAHVWADGKMWIYPSHDQDDATSYNSMNGHHVFSSEDLVTWTDHGEIMHTDDISWAKNGYLWAPDCAYKDGTYYYYYPARESDDTRRIGVATSPSPSGPFTDSGSYIPETDEIDPACFIDDDGQAYLYWGGHSLDLRIVKLNDDMKSHSGVTKITVPDFYEGPWMHKRNGIYYLSYATGVNRPIAYCTSTSPMGPFTYRGIVMAKVPDCPTNHHSIVKYKGRWYIFYHSVALSGHGNRRSVCIDYLYYNEDGTIQQVIQTDEGVAPVSLVDNEDNYPFVQAENYTSATGISIQPCSDTDGGEMVEFLEVGDEISFDLDILPTDTHDVAIRVSSESSDIAFDLYNGTNLLGSVSRIATGSDQNWTTLYLTLPLNVGSMDLRVVATGGGWNMNWIQFSIILPLSPDRENIALNQAASASNVHSSPYGADQAVDGDMSTRWATSVATPWLEVDFGVPTMVEGMKISEYKSPRIRGYEIQYFDDAWHTAFVGDSIVDGQVYSFPRVQGTKFRLQVTSSSLNPTIWEFELFGKARHPVSAMNVDSSSVSLMWSGESGSTYALQYSTNLAVDAFSTIESGIPAQEATNINRMAMPDDAAFYRVIAE